MDETIKNKIEAALALQQNNETEAAMNLFKEVLTIDPTQPDALHGMGLALAQLRRFPEAIPYFQKAITAAPSVAQFHNNLGNAYKALSKVEEAMRHYREALRLRSPYPEAHNNLGTLLYKIGKYEEAIDQFQKSLRMQPESADTHYNIANSYVQIDRLLDAAAHYREVLKTHPDHLGALHNLGISLSVMKHFQEAQPLLEQVIQREPNNIDALFHLGIIYGALSEPEKAKACYEKVLALNADHAAAHHNIATLYLHLKDPESALAHYQTALALQPENKTAKHMVAALKGQTLPEGAPNEYIRALFDQYAYSYDTHVKTHLHYQVPHLLRAALTPFLNPAQDPWKAADLGCGTGLCAPLFADIVGKLIGVDISPNMIEVAKQGGGYYKLYVMDVLEFLQRYKEEFNLVIAADVFVYLGQLDTLFSACWRALQSPGFFCFSIETLMPEEIAAQPEFPDFQLRKTGRYAHNPAYIQRLAEQTNFKIEVANSETLRHQEEGPMMGNIYVLKK